MLQEGGVNNSSGFFVIGRYTQEAISLQQFILNSHTQRNFRSNLVPCCSMHHINNQTYWRHKEQTFGHSVGRKGWDDLRE